jgi:hypothetical protein
MSLAVQVAGALLVLAAFALVQLRVLTTSALSYLLLNVVGSAALAGSAAVNGQWGFVLLNAVWLLVSLASLVGLARRRRRGPATGSA